MRCLAVLLFCAAACGERAVEPYQDPSACDIERAVEDAAEDAEPETIDCGFVVLSHDLARWEAAHDCATAALTAGDPVQLIWQPEALDSTGYVAVVSADEITRFSYDDYQGEITFASQSCSEVRVVADCEVAVGDMCLQCIGRGDPTQICTPA
jgi:hypothetical protein